MQLTAEKKKSKKLAELLNINLGLTDDLYKKSNWQIVDTFINEKDAEEYYTNILRKIYDKFSSRNIYALHKTEWEELLDIWQEQLRNGK